MVTNTMTFDGEEQLLWGTASSLRVNRRIENSEIPLFMQQCVIDATQWEVEGTQYDQWRAQNGNGRYSASEWRDHVVTSYLQQRFEGLEVDDDNHLYGVRGSAREEIDTRFYNRRQLQGSMLARCPGQGWLFALGCCRRMRRR